MARALLMIAILAMGLAIWLGSPSAAWAQGQGDGVSDEDRAAAQVLFDEGQAFREQEKWAEAAKKFEASQRLDPSVGTQLNLALCFEKLGRTASAWINYHEVSQISSDRRAGFAKEQADRLEPNLVMLHLKIKRRIPGMRVTRGDEVMEEPTWNEPVPVDPGTYDIVVKAPGHLPWRETVELTAKGETIELAVPALIEDPNAPKDDVVPDPRPEAPPPEPDNTQLIAGAVVAGLGVIGIGIGVGLAVVGHNKNDESLAFCPSDPNMCFAEGVSLREEAQSLQAGYFGAFIVGGAALVTGLVVILLAPSGDAGGGDTEAHLSIYPGGVGITGTF